ncbi:HDOD domain-containing protein [Reinekea forsetii]|nr:HDOD domain-containing protein [Reinekea forsetii]
MLDQSNPELLEWLTSLEKLDQTKIISSETQKLLDELGSEDLNIARVSQLLESEPILCARILMIANSPFFGFARQIDRIEEAVVIIGSKTLTSLIYTSTLLKSTSNPSVLPYAKHSLTTALFGKALAEATNEDKDQAYLGGLLHLLPVIANYHPKLEGQLSNELLQAAASTLLVKIGMPESTCHNITNLYSDNPDNSQSKILKLANAMAIILTTEDCPFSSIPNLETLLSELSIKPSELATMCARVESEQHSLFRLLG